MDVESLLREAVALGDEDDWEGMAKALLDGLEANPGDPSLLCWLGVAEREMGLPGAAYDHFKEALAQGPEDPFLLATVGNGLAQFDDPEAESALRSASILGPDILEARLLFGAYLAREGLFEEAIGELTAAAELAPDDPLVSYEVGVALALQGHLEPALEALGRSVDLEEGDGWGQVVLGLVEAELGRMEEAARDLSSGARLRPQDVDVQFLAALAASASGYEDLAYEMMERGRQVAEAGDLPILEAVEGSIEDGAEASNTLLVQELLSGALRERLMNRP